MLLYNRYVGGMMWLEEMKLAFRRRFSSVAL
jgi:hypothetical protein